MNELARSGSLWSVVVGYVRRQFEDVQPGVDHGREQPVLPGYPARSSLSAMAAFPWVWACVQAIQEDLSQLPIRVGRYRSDDLEELLPDHELQRLLDHPSPQVSSLVLRQQLIVDLVLAGNSYIWRREIDGIPSLLRLHPALTEPVVGAFGWVSGYRYTDPQLGQRVEIPFSEVVHIHGPSWSDSADSILGESPIRCLNDDLNAELNAKQQSSKASKRGRPDILISAADPKMPLGSNLIQRAKDAWTKATQQGDGAVFIGSGLEAKQLGWSPRDMEYPAQREQTRAAVLAVFGVPPARVGLPGANYATDRNQSKIYWQGLKGRAALIDDGLSRLTGDPDVRVAHDFHGVEALQSGRTEQQTRAKVWVDSFGADPKEAVRYEGLAGAPTGEASANYPDIKATNDRQLRALRWIEWGASVEEALAFEGLVGAPRTLSPPLTSSGSSAQRSEPTERGLSGYLRSAVKRWKIADDLVAQSSSEVLHLRSIGVPIEVADRLVSLHLEVARSVNRSELANHPAFRAEVARRIISVKWAS